jgi:citrate synthase
VGDDGEGRTGDEVGDDGKARVGDEALADGGQPRGGEQPLSVDQHWAVPGFGHPVHRHGDPRAAPLLRAVATIATPADRELIDRTVHGAPAPPSVDFALGALCHVGRMPPQAATAIFAVARTAGWIAHAAEEYTEPRLRFRGRAVMPVQGRPGGGKLDY